MSNKADLEGFFRGTGFQPVIPLKSTQLGPRKRNLPHLQMALAIHLPELEWLPQDLDFQTNHRLEACATEKSEAAPFRHSQFLLAAWDRFSNLSFFTLWELRNNRLESCPRSHLSTHHRLEAGATTTLRKLTGKGSNVG
jgi:hypothetical protein